MGLLDDYAQLLTNERQKQKIKGLLGVADTVTGADQIRGIPADPRNWSIDDTAKMLNFAGGGIGSIKVSHGSPHTFDKFDMSKIGTGEGAQAYGHGLYFAESPDVATKYADNISPIPSDDITGWTKWMLGSGVSQDDVISILKNDGKDISEISKIIDSAKNKVYAGNLYNVSLEWPDAAREAADPLGPQHFLDWGKKTKDQTEIVKSALQEIDYPMLNAWRENGAWDHVRGADIYGALGGRTFGDMSSGKMAKGSEAILATGIPGIRYLDGGSRGAGEGSYNYVVFDDQIPRILERNGKPLKGLLDK